MTGLGCQDFGMLQGLECGAVHLLAMGVMVTGRVYLLSVPGARVKSYGGFAVKFQLQLSPSIRRKTG